MKALVNVLYGSAVLLGSIGICEMHVDAPMAVKLLVIAAVAGIAGIMTNEKRPHEPGKLGGR